MPRTIAHDKRTKNKKQADFLEKLEEYASVTRAAKVSKVPRRTIYQWIEDDANFKKKYDSSCAIAISSLEDEAVRRAYEGTVRPVFQGGKSVGKIREYSDTLLIVLLKARAPEKYKDRFQGEFSGPNGKPIQTENTTTILYIPEKRKELPVSNLNGNGLTHTNGTK